MSKKPIFIGNSRLALGQKLVRGEFVNIDNEPYYKIHNFHSMSPFFMSIVSDSDHWMFIWSNGALSAGRKNPDHMLFPYYTDDKIKDSSEITGSKTLLIVDSDVNRYLWEPLSSKYEGLYNIQRNCYKSIYGNKLILEEINNDLNLSFSYCWMNSSKYGFVKKSQLKNLSGKNIEINVLDGIQNILCSGIDQKFQNDFSTLADAYKKCELDPGTGLAVYSLSSIPVDRAEPSEALRSTIVWSVGIKADRYLLSSEQLSNFRNGETLHKETDIRAVPGAYFINTVLNVEVGSSISWYMVADIDQDMKSISIIKRLLGENNNFPAKIESDIVNGTNNLKKIVSASDGMQKSSNVLRTSRHFSNTLFNVMRGGIFDDNLYISKQDFISFCRNANKQLVKKYQKFFEGLPEQLLVDELIDLGTKKGDLDLNRLCYEYLPLTFSRRHGDPSRPWNRFSINLVKETGEKELNYQGNWRDIFQNWEALALSYPAFIESMITKFVNASTADGYNPYRITRDGFDWEVMDPDDAWSFIGYWGDHQIIYLLKLLELSRKFHPNKIHELLSQNVFVYANVPYRIKAYSDILTDPYNTIDFDQNLHNELIRRENHTGSDGKFISDTAENIYHVNLVEKLLVPILSKLSNFVPEAGIWMNTQRPEWNDANNALVGYGVSMVTLYYLRRHISFCRNLFREMSTNKVEVSREVVEYFQKTVVVLKKNTKLLDVKFTDEDRKIILDLLGSAGSDYRQQIYQDGFSGVKRELSYNSLVEFCDYTIRYIDHSIKYNKRNDHLYHAYNLISISDESVTIRHLYEMLEGQVAVLSSGFLTPEYAVQVLDALRKSRLYRKDQNSYILYPDRLLPHFVDKNKIPPEKVSQSQLLKKLISIGDRRIVIEDCEGEYHFNGDFRNAQILESALNELDHEFKDLRDQEKNMILDIYEEIFDHQSFTGRSGTFFKYEGLGSIYWHMVSKLLLAVQENYYNAIDSETEDSVIERIKNYYYEIQNGIGIKKSPEIYGGFPTDPYSHTPAHTGVQQPGMTGQVKEDILSRFGELGVGLVEGKLSFSPGLFKKEEFLTAPNLFIFYDIHGFEKCVDLEPGCLAFTLAQTPIIYHNSEEQKIVITFESGLEKIIKRHTLSKEDSNKVFNRQGEIKQIDVFFNIQEIL